MVALFCAIVGVKGSAFSVRVDDGDSVDDLKVAINARISRTTRCNAQDLQLFPATMKDGEWLSSSTQDVKKLKKGEKTPLLESLTHEDIELQGESLVVKFLADMETPKASEIHVLVVVLKHRGTDPRLLQIQAILLRYLWMDALSSTSVRGNDFKASLIRTYQCDMGTDDKKNPMLRCMLLNMALPSELVSASHVFRRKNEFISRELMGIAQIDDVKNGLLLFKPLKHTFDHLQISFIYDKDSDEFRLRVFDSSLRQQRLFATLNPDQRKILLRGQALSKNWKIRGPRNAPGTNFNIQTTFGDVEGLPLCFRSVERPYKRCLSLQARLARMKAIEAKWVEPDQAEFEDFWSEGMSLAEKIDFFNVRIS